MASMVFLGVDILSYFCWVDVWFFGCSCPNLTGLDQNDAWFWVILNFRLQTVTNPRSEVLVESLGSCPISPRLMQWVGCVGIGLADGGRFGVQLDEERQRPN